MTVIPDFNLILRNDYLAVIRIGVVSVLDEFRQRDVVATYKTVA